MTPQTLRLTFQFIITLAVIVPFWLFVYAIFFHGAMVDSSMRDTVNQVTGGIMTAFAGALGFWIGSSLSSSSKDHTISQLTTGQKP